MISLLASLLRLSCPLIYAALGGLLCERSGVATICLEGVMLNAAFAAASVNYATHRPVWAVIAGIAAGTLTMALHAFLCLKAKADAIVSGVAVNILGAGLTPFLSKVFFESPTNTPSIPLADRMVRWGNSDADGGIAEIFYQSPLVYLALLLPLVVAWLLYKTRWGLHILSSGDGPEALRTSGVKPNRVRFEAMFLGGALCSLGGVYLSIAHGAQFTRDMTAGRGFIALTAVIFGKWKPIPTFAACLLFGLADALQIQFQGTHIGGFEIPVQFISALPYLITLCVLVGAVGHARPPRALGTRLD